MDNWFKSKWFVRAVSLAFAILLYVFVNIEATTSPTDPRVPSGSDEVQTINDMPVDIRIDSDRFVVSGVPEFVTVSLEGTNSVLTPTVRQRNFDVFVDLEELGDGTHTVDIEHDRIPSELSVYIEPKTIEVTIEERASKEFPVTVDFINRDKLPEGYELGTPEVKPETVTITSSKSVIDQIEIVKAYIDVSGITESINNREVSVNVYDGQGNGLNVRIEPENVVVSVEVDNPSKLVPVNVSTTGDLPEDYSLNSISANTEEIEVFATTSTLAEINDLSTEEIDLADISESGTIDVELMLPDGAVVSDNSIEVTIELEQTRTIDEIPVDIESTDGQNLSHIKPASPEMKVTIVGDEKDVSKIEKEDIRLYVDVKDLEEGEHDVPLIIEGPEDVKISAEFEKMTIGITE